VEPRLSDVKPVIYIARATLDNAQLIAWQVKAASSSSSHGGSRYGASVTAAFARLQLLVPFHVVQTLINARCYKLQVLRIRSRALACLSLYSSVRKLEKNRSGS
jgi:hypothetical protein